MATTKIKLKHKGKVQEKTISNNKSAVRKAAGERKAPTMKHQTEERGGSKDEERSLISEYISDKLESIIKKSEENKKPLSDEDGEEHEFDD